MTALVLAGDIGGTNSRLALFSDRGIVFERTYPSVRYDSLEAVVQTFLTEASTALGPSAMPGRACLAVAGPVVSGAVRITNLPWVVEAARLSEVCGIPVVRLANDFEAAATGVPLLGPEDLVLLGGEPPVARGPAVVAGPGTGLGAAFLFWSQVDQRYEVVPSEAGHIDFAPRTPFEQGLASYLAARHGGHVSYERVVSGPGLRDLFSYLLEEPACARLATEETRAAFAPSPPVPAAPGSPLVVEDRAAVIVRQAVAGRDPLCAMAVDLFSSVLGALLGNLALAVLATGGVFIAGGIAPRLLTLLPRGPLRASFEAKGRFGKAMARTPIYVVTNGELGLLGAASLARR